MFYMLVLYKTTLEKFKNNCFLSYKEYVSILFHMIPLIY